MRDASDADDVEQQVWLAALRSPPRQASGLRAWLGTVARNVVYRRRRTETRLRRREHIAGERAARTVASPIDVVARAETHRTVVSAVLALPEPQRRAVLLRYFDDRGVDEIARETGVPVETTRSRLRLARGRLRTRLAPDVKTARSLGLLVLAGGGLESLSTSTALAASSTHASATTFFTGVVTMSMVTKVVASVAVLVALGLGIAWQGAASDAEVLALEAVSLRDDLAERGSAFETVDRERRRLRRDLAAVRQRADGLSEQLTRMQRDGPESPRSENAPGARRRGKTAEGPGPGGAKAENPPEVVANAEWRRDVQDALRDKPDSERHAWAIAQLTERLLDETDPALRRWAASTLDRVARDGGVGPVEATQLERAFRGVADDSPAGPPLAAAVAVGWTRDERLHGFLASIPVAREKVQTMLLRTLDHHPTTAFSDLVLRILRDEGAPGAVLSSVMDEDRASAAAVSQDHARDLVAEYARRLRGSALTARQRENGYLALAVAGLRVPSDAAVELRSLAGALDEDDESRKPLLTAADLLGAGDATQRILKDLLD